MFQDLERYRFIPISEPWHKSAGIKLKGIMNQAVGRKYIMPT